MIVAVGSDHAGYDLKATIEVALQSIGHSTIDIGATSSESFDYPLAADGVATSILKGEAECGVLICGTGIGVSIRANRYFGIRAAVCCSVQTAKLARQHNHANVLCLGARTTSPELAENILLAFLEAEPDTQDRHVRRIELLDGNLNSI